jgi:hypothetical protein
LDAGNEEKKASRSPGYGRSEKGDGGVGDSEKMAEKFPCLPSAIFHPRMKRVIWEVCHGNNIIPLFLALSNVTKL